MIKYQKLLGGILSLLVVWGLMFGISSAFASEANGTIVSGANAGYAWSNQAGWVNFGATNGNIVITDSGITGYAWNSNYGWINMAPTNGGVLISASGALSGYAWGASLGWINFTGVSINSSGRFVGQATGTIVGTLTFDCTNCSVTTDYRPQNFRTTTTPPPVASGGGGGGGGGLPPGYSNSPIAPAEGFAVSINNGAPGTNSRNIVLNLRGGPDTVRMAISNSPGFETASQEAYQTTKEWTLSEGEGLKTIYVKYYTQYGYSSDVFSDSISLVSTLTPGEGDSILTPTPIPAPLIPVIFTPSREEETPREQAPKFLFDIRLLLDRDEITRIEDLVARVTFDSFGRAPTPVEMEFILLNSDGSEIWKSVDTITVETSAVFAKRFLEAPKLAPGSYVARMNTLYNIDVRDTFEAPFTILSEIEVTSYWLAWFFGAILVAIFIILFFIWRRRREEETNHI